MKIFLSILSTVLVLGANAQDEGVVLQAMKDELNRNMEQLKADDNPPFYISYSLSKTRQTQLSAFFGGIMSYSVDTVRGWNARVMVGDYTVNDENYSDNQDSEFNYIDYPPIPGEDNYDAIRRFFWVSTNNIFVEANRLYKSKKEKLKDFELTYDAPDFDSTDVVQLNVPLEVDPGDPEALKSMAKELSKWLSEDKSLFSGQLAYSDQIGTIQFVNSEGTQYQIPTKRAILFLNIQKLFEDGEVLSVAQQFDFESGGEMLKNKEEVFKEVTNLTKKLSEYKKLELDSYYGPVLLTGTLGADLLANSVSSKLEATRNTLSLSSEEMGKNYFEDFKKKHDKEESIGNKNLSVTALPTLESYDGIKLTGKVLIDSEGVIPDDTIKLVVDGKIIEKLNGRTPAPKALRSNGHYLNHLSYGGLQKSIGPSNILFEFKESRSFSELKERLITEIKEQDLEFGLIMKPAYKGGVSIMELIKVYPNGNEESFITNHIPVMGANILRKVIGTSDELKVYNDGGSRFVNPHTIICPDAILIKDFNHTSYDQRNEPYVLSIPMPTKD